MEHSSSSKTSHHCRSQSAPDFKGVFGSYDTTPQGFQRTKKMWEKGKKSLPQERRAMLKRDVAQLKLKLHGQLAVRDALENALAKTPTSNVTNDMDHIPKQTEKMIKDIAALEFEVARLEQHLLLLYRKVFEQNFLATFYRRGEPISEEDQYGIGQLSSERQNSLKGNAVQRSYSSLSQSSCGPFLLSTGPKLLQKYGDNSVQRSQSSLSHVSSSSFGVKQSPWSEDSLNDSFSLSQRLCQGFEGRIARLADHLGTCISNHCLESPNRLSEDLLHFMAAIYCKLSEPPLPRIIFPTSPTSSLASSAVFSPKDRFRKFSDAVSNGKRDVRLSDPFGVKLERESTGAYDSMIEVPWICADHVRLGYTAHMLYNFKSLVRRLDKVDPAILNHEEKLAFWINIYNTLMMHAYLVYGVPRNYLKRLRLLHKAAYKIGGHSLNAYIIENIILRCHLYRPVQWLQSFFLGGMKPKGSNEIKAYALAHPEPLVCFALCSGNHSDPAVRAYTAKNVHSELEVARDDYLKASIGIKKGNKLFLPKILQGFSRELCLSEIDLVDFACQFLPPEKRNSVAKISRNKPHKSIEWQQYSINFRYIFSRDLGHWVPPLIT